MDNTSSDKKLGIGQAVLIGHLIITIPCLVLMLGIIFLGYLVFGFNRAALLVILGIGFVIAWTWWSFYIPRWRRWAHQQGADPDKLQKLALMTGLVWPKGWIFEKTEFKLKDEE